MNNRSTLRRLLVLAAFLAIAGCGGGGGGGGFFPVATGTGGGGSTSSVPASAMQSVDAFYAYMKVMVASGSEMDSPIALGDAVAPVSETTEPSGP